MALFDSADLLARSKKLLNRPSVDESMTYSTTDDIWYDWLTNAQLRVTELIAWYAPENMYGAPTALVTADSGRTYTFGTDADGNNIAPIGLVEIRVGPNGQMLSPGNDWDSTTDVYLFESDKIRWPAQKTRTFTNGLYARFVTPPNVLSAASAPTLKPVYARELLPYDACIQAAIRLDMDPTPYETLFNKRWPEILSTMKGKMFGQGLAAQPMTRLWWRSADLGS